MFQFCLLILSFLHLYLFHQSAQLLESLAELCPWGLPPWLGFYLWVFLSCSMVSPSWVCQLVGRHLLGRSFVSWHILVHAAGFSWCQKILGAKLWRDLAGKNAPVKVLLLLCKDEGQRLQQCQRVGVWVLLLMFWWSRHSSLPFCSIGKMIDCLLKLLWCKVALTWESLIHKLWVGNRGWE